MSHWLTAERLRVYPRIFLGLFLLALVGYPLTFRGGLDPTGHPAGSDFITFWSAASLVLQGRAVEVYDVLALVGVQQSLAPGLSGGFAWFYPPTFLAVVTPLGLLPYLVALAVFVVAGVALWAWTMAAATGRRDAAWLVAAFPGAWVCAVHGQNGLLTAALAGGTVLLLGRGRSVAAGALLGLLVIKPHLAVLFPLLLIARRDWRAFVAAAVTATAGLAASVAWLGVDTLPAWLESTRLAQWAVEAGALPWAKMPSTLAALLSWGAPVPLAYAAHAVVAVVAVVVCWRVCRQGPLPLAGAAVMTATMLVNPYAFDYDLVWLSFPIAWVALDGLARGWWPGDREVLVAAWVLPLLLPAVAGVLHLPLAPVVLLALLGVVVRRLRPVRPGPLWQDAPMRRWADRLAVAVLAAVVLAVLAIEITALIGIRATGILGDLTIYRQAMEFQQAGGSIYDYLYVHPRVHGLGFTYPPFAAIVLRPLTWGPEPVVAVAWVVLTVATFAALTAWVVAAVVRDGSWLGVDPPPARVAAAALGAIGLGTLTFPFLHHLVVGQVSLFVIALCLIDVGGLVPPRWRGVLVGVAAAVKLTPLVFVPYFLVRRQYRSAALATGTFVGASALAWLVFPSDSLAYWGTKLLQTSRVGALDSPINKSLLGTLSRLGLGGGAALAVWLLLGGVVAAVVLLRARRNPGLPPLVAALEVGCLGTLISPISWPHHQLVAVFAAVWLLLQPDPRRVWLGVVVLGSFLAYAGFLEEGAGPATALLREASVAAVVLLCLVGLARPVRTDPAATG